MHWLAAAEKRASFKEVLGFTFNLPFALKGKRKVEYLEKEGEYYKVQFTNLHHPIYWPADIDLKHLYQVAAEILYPQNWWNYEIDETRIGKNDVVLDCGAAEGLFSLFVAPRCKKCYAVEPLPKFISSMLRTFQDVPKVEILALALGREEGTLRLSENGIMSQIGDEGGVAVTLTTVDRLFADSDEKITFIKADLEGYEVQMLEGAREVLKRHNPKLSITTYHNEKDAQLTVQLIKDTNPKYNIKQVGIEDRFGTPIMLHAWI